MFDKAGIDRTEIYSQTNARNRDVHTTWYKINTDSGSIRDDSSAQERLKVYDMDRETIEDELIDYLDVKRTTEGFIACGYGKRKARKLADETIALLAKKALRKEDSST